MNHDPNTKIRKGITGDAGDKVSIPLLRPDFHGRVIAPGEPGYDERRATFYGGIDHRPAFIVQAADARDVARAISLARDTGLELSVRSGGHSISGLGVSDGGILLDLGLLQALEIDTQGRTAWAQAGLTAGQYTTAVGAYGLATGFGDTGSVGLGGITLGGGVGYLVRKHGLTIDDLLSAEIVTAAGEVLQVDARSRPDLFWAIRGGGGNFGVATRFQYRLHDVPQVVGGMLILPATPETIAAFIAEAQAAPEELSTIANVIAAPPMPFLPAEAHGKLVLMAILAYAGPVEAGQRAVAPFRALATPIADMVHPMPYAEIYPPDDDSYHPLAVGRNLFLDAFDRETAALILDRIRASRAAMAVTQIRALGGAMARVPNDATAFAHRNRKIMVNLGALYQDPAELAEHEAWIDGFRAALSPNDPGAYVNFLASEGPERTRAAYPGPTWDRLRQIKRRYDPTNLFHLNQNIPPA